MEMTELLNEVARLINQASTYNAEGMPDNATRSLAELRELLLMQTELPAPGEPEKPEESEAK